MQEIKLSSIQEGQQFEHNVYLRSGRMLLSAGSVVTASQRSILTGLPDSVVYMAESLDDLVEAGLVKKPKDYRPSRPARTGYLDEEEADQAAKRQQHVKVAETQVADLLDQCRKLPLRVQPQARTVWDGHTPGNRRWPDVAGLEQRRDELAAVVESIYQRLVDGEHVGIDELHKPVDRLFADLLDFRQRFTQIALLGNRRQNYLPGHAVCVATLAMATAGQLAWAPDDVRRVGVAGLLADAGMMLVPERIRTGGCELTELDRNRIHRHPGYSVALLRLVDGADALTRLAAYQHHERESALGYPRAERGDGLCDYARVIGIVDVFAAATSPRAWSKAKLPYTIMEEIIRSAASGTFCRATVRALVAAAGLFPVGSFVQLSNQRTAKILAANPKQLDRPLIGLLGEDGKPTSEPPVDLSKIPADRLAVIKPIAEPEPEPAPAAA